MRQMVKNFKVWLYSKLGVTYCDRCVGIFDQRRLNAGSGDVWLCNRCMDWYMRGQFEDRGKQ